MKVHLELNEQDLRSLVLVDIASKLGRIDVLAKDVRIEVKSKQNYKSEWEEAAFRAVVDK